MVVVGVAWAGVLVGWEVAGWFQAEVVAVGLVAAAGWRLRWSTLAGVQGAFLGWPWRLRSRFVLRSHSLCF